MQPIIEETPDLFKSVLPDDCSDEDKERHSIEAKKVVNALKSGKDVEIRNAVIEGDFILESEIIKGTVTIERTNFRDPVDCSYTTFKHLLNLNGSTFEADADFYWATFKKGVSFKKSTFEKGKADFGRTRIEGDAGFTEAVFEQMVIFNGTQIEGAAFFGTTTFKGKAIFTGAQIGNQAIFDGAIFKQRVSFNGAQIEKSAFFRPATFEGKVRPVAFEGETDFMSSRVVCNAEFTLAQFKEKVFFIGALFKADILFDGTVFEKDVNFQNTSFRTCFFERPLHVPWPEEYEEIPQTQFNGKIDLRGCTYERIYPTGIWKELMDRLETYDCQPFTQLEETFRKAGEDKLANNVYYKRKIREAAQIKIWDMKHPLKIWKWAQPFPLIWMGNRFLWLCTKYGLQPWRILLASIIIVVLGSLIFQIDTSIELKQNSEQITIAKIFYDVTSDKSVPHGLCDGFWLSVKFFLPVEIPFGSEWKPSSKTFLRIKFSTYATILKLLGWVLVPVGVAGLTGILKR
jgi:uncharacterized protein YjbI with pentapeptide repeats